MVKLVQWISTESEDRSSVRWVVLTGHCTGSLCSAVETGVVNVVDRHWYAGLFDLLSVTWMENGHTAEFTIFVFCNSCIL